MARKFIKNNLNAILGIASEQLIIQPFGSIVIEGELSLHPEIAECVQKGWATVTEIPDSAPAPVAENTEVKPVKVELAEDMFKGSLTPPNAVKVEEPVAEVVTTEPVAEVVAKKGKKS